MVEPVQLPVIPGPVREALTELAAEFEFAEIVDQRLSATTASQPN